MVHHVYYPNYSYNYMISGFKAELNLIWQTKFNFLSVLQRDIRIDILYRQNSMCKDT